MLQNAYFLATIRADTAENEQNLAEILPKTGNYPTGPPGRTGAARSQRRPLPYLPTVLPGSGEQVCFLSSRFLALLLLALAGRSTIVQRDLCSVFGIFGFIRSIA